MPSFIPILIILPFSIFLFVTGLKLTKIKSLYLALQEYETNPHTATWFHHWFLWWRLPLQRRFAYHTINKLGDRFVTFFYRLAGIFFILLALTFPIVLIITSYQPVTTPSSTSTPIFQTTTNSIIPSPSPTPFAFQELTIPHLRSRTFQSILGQRNQALETSAYTAYLTSYDSDGLSINGLLYVPKGPVPDQGWPAVVFLHGYIPPQQYQTLVNYNSYAGTLANQGLVVFKIDLRGHAQSEGDPSGAYYSADYIIDTLHAYNALQNYDQVNPDQIGLWGHSMAGNIVFRALAVIPTIPKVVIWAGAVYSYEDFSQFGIDDNSYQPPPEQSEISRKREELFNTYGEFDPTSWFWQQVPATNYLDGIKGSVQIHHAINDPVVDIDYSKNLMTILDSTTIPHQLFEYSSGGHNLTDSTFTTAMDRSADFLTDY